jgi:shikimate kinase
MNNKSTKLDGIILMGPFGSGKTYLGNRLREQGVADYVDLEPIVYSKFSDGEDFDVAGATEFIRDHYYEQLVAGHELVAFESTGVVQRPLLLEVMAKFNIALIRLRAPKALCLDRVARRNQTSKHPVDLDKAGEFFDYWHNDIAPTYEFSLEVDGTDVVDAIEKIRLLKDSYCVM